MEETMNPNEISWSICQKNSDAILDSGLKYLQSNPRNSLSNKFQSSVGNYLINDDSGKWKYIGEGKELSKRIKQQSKINTSTFYKNYNC